MPCKFLTETCQVWSKITRSPTSGISSNNFLLDWISGLNCGMAVPGRNFAAYHKERLSGSNYLIRTQQSPNAGGGSGESLATSSVKYCLPSKVSSIKGRLPSKVIFRQRLSSIKGRLLSKFVFHRRGPPSKIVFHQRSSSSFGSFSFLGFSPECGIAQLSLSLFVSSSWST